VEKIRRGIALTDDDRQPWLERVRARQGHFAGEQILASQLADLEEPDRAVIVDIAATPQQITAEIRKELSLA
jgi:gluconate kinase